MTTTFSPQDFLADQSFRMLIGGELVAPNGGSQTETLDPSTGAVLTSVPEASADDVGAGRRGGAPGPAGVAEAGLGGASRLLRSTGRAADGAPRAPRAARRRRLREPAARHAHRRRHLPAVPADLPRHGLGPARARGRRQRRPALHEDPPLRGGRAHPGLQPSDDVRRHPAAAGAHHRQHRRHEAGPPDAAVGPRARASCSPRRSRRAS